MTQFMFKYTVAQLIKLKESVDTLRELEGLKVEPLTEELMKCFKRDFHQNAVFFTNEANYLFDEIHSGVCGCIGPKNGDPYCGCTMGRLRYEYRYDIALALITETSAVEYDDVKWAKQELAKHLSKLAQEKKIKEQKEFNAVILQALNGDRVAN